MNLYPVVFFLRVKSVNHHTPMLKQSCLNTTNGYPTGDELFPGASAVVMIMYDFSNHR